MKRYGSKIIAVSYFVPEKIVRTSDIEEKLQFKEKIGVPYGILERLTGCREHREAPPGTDASDLAVAASRRALSKADISIEIIDLIIFAACCQDIYEPATANIIAEKLGAKKIQLFDIKNACNSFINSIDIVDSLISTGKVKYGLIASGEVASKYVDYNILNKDDLVLKASGLTLGDAGAALIMTENKADDDGFCASHFSSDGSQWRLATILGGGTMYPRDPKMCYFLSDGEKIIDLAFKKIPPEVKKVLAESGWTPNDVDLVIAHQVTIKIIHEIMNAV
ncbi:hypothetical protein A2Y85_05250, partial [candidate division WOR-3 bacterium RBG_13_43_14]